MNPMKCWNWFAALTSDINTITTKKKQRHATLAAAKKKDYAENQKRARAKEKRAYKEIVPKQAEEIKRLKMLVTELGRTTVLLTQPAPRQLEPRTRRV